MLIIIPLELNLFTSLDLIEVTVTVLKMNFYGTSVFKNISVVALQMIIYTHTFHKLASINNGPLQVKCRTSLSVSFLYSPLRPYAPAIIRGTGAYTIQLNQ